VTDLIMPEGRVATFKSPSCESHSQQHPDYKVATSTDAAQDQPLDSAALVPHLGLDLLDLGPDADAKPMSHAWSKRALPKNLADSPQAIR
jgi:hypothetical protein